MKVNNFDDDLAYERDMSKTFDKFYYSLFPNLIDIKRASMAQERQGIDKILIFNDETTIKVQEKVRREDYGDFLIEFGHKLGVNEDKGRRLGWIAYIRADIIYYLTGGKFYVIPLLDLMGWLKSHMQYLKDLKWTKAFNKRGEYWTYSKCVPWDKFDFIKVYEKD